jgi:hypothetical protein
MSASGQLIPKTDIHRMPAGNGCARPSRVKPYRHRHFESVLIRLAILACPVL